MAVFFHSVSKSHKGRCAEIMLTGFLSFCVLGSVVFIYPFPAFSQSFSDTNSRLNRIENEIQTLSRAIYKGEMPPPSALPSGSARQQANAEIRVQQLERELRAVTGKLEEQNHQISTLKSRFERMVSDINMRLSDFEGGPKSSSFVSQKDSIRSPSSPYDAPSSKTVRAVETNPQALNQAIRSAQQGQSGYQWNSKTAMNVVPKDVVGGTLGTLSRSVSPSTSFPAPTAQNYIQGTGDQAAVAYENAFALLKNARYPAAEQEFQEFLSQYPDHVLAGNAKYWLGETFYVRKDYERAARIFAEGYQQYPKGAKAADNLLKLGMSLAGLGNVADACVALGQLEKENVAGSGPVLRRAQQEKTRLGC